jgi:DUF4097 and DUF4098 domain-containing protein YvlB
VKSQRQLATVLVLTVACALPLSAQNSKVYREGNSWVEEISGNVPAAKNLKVTTEAGAVTVQGGNQKDITYVIKKRVYGYLEDAARKQLERFRVTASRRGEWAVIEGSWEGGSPRKFSGEFAVHVPQGIELVKVNTDGGGMAVRNIAGRVEAESGGGGVQLADIGGAVSAETGGGAVEVSNTSGPLRLSTGGGSIRVASAKGTVSVETGGGSIAVSGSAQAVSAQTGGGSIDVQKCGGELRVSTGGGSIEVGEVNGRAVLETGGGSIRLTSAQGPVTASTGGGSIALYKLMQGARAETGAGGITAEFLGAGSDSSLQTSAGDVVVYVSPQAKMTVRASIQMAGGHKIRSDFSELKITTEGGEWGPRNVYAEGNINGGGPVLKVRTMSGNIEFRRASR